MNIFKNKYYKIFPLSIFITKCADAKVTFIEKCKINIYKTEIKYDEKNFIDKNYNLLCSNNENFSINKKSSIENLLSINNYNDINNKKIELGEIKKQLSDYTYMSHNVYKEKNGKIDFKIGNDFIDNYKYNFYFYKNLNFNNIKFKLDNNDFKVSFKSNITTMNIYDVIEEYKKTEKEEDYRYSDIIEKILNEICNGFNAENYFLVINKKEINYNDDNITKEIYKNFISRLLNNEEINVELKKSYHLIINEVLLSNDLTKIYKIDNNKVKDLKVFLTSDYPEKKYLDLQNDLKDDDDYEKVKIENGEKDTEITNIDDVTITITADPDKKIIVPKQCTIEFKAGNNLFITDSTNYPTSKIIDFSDIEGGITTDINIENYINKTYPDIKDKCTITKTNDNSGNFKDGTVVTVTIDKEIDGITTKKDPNKVYVKVNFEVSDNTKYKLKENILKLNNNELEFEKDSKYENLIEKIKKNLGNISFKDGFTVIFSNSNFTSGNNLTNDGVYTFKLDNLDTNFVEEIVKDKQEKPEDHKNPKKDDDKETPNKEQNTPEQKETKTINNKKCCGGNKKCSDGNKKNK